MTRNEKRLGITFLLIIGIGTVAITGKFYLNRRAALNTEYQSILTEIEEMEEITKTKALWDSREDWLSRNIPKAISDEKMDLELSELTKLKADSPIEINNLEYLKNEVTAHFNVAKVRFNVDGQLGEVMTWLHGLILKEKFLTINQIRIRQGDEDDGTAKCQVELHKYYGQ